VRIRSSNSSRADSRTCHAALLSALLIQGQRGDVTESEENGAGTSEPCDSKAYESKAYEIKAYESKAYEWRVRKRHAGEQTNFAQEDGRCRGKFDSPG